MDRREWAMPLKLREVDDVLIVDVGHLIAGPVLNPRDGCPFYREECGKYLCDIRGCSVFDSAAITNLVGLYWQLAPRNVSFKVLAGPEHLPLFDLTGLDTVFGVFVDEHEAIASFAQSGRP